VEHCSRQASVLLQSRAVFAIPGDDKAARPPDSQYHRDGRGTPECPEVGGGSTISEPAGSGLSNLVRLHRFAEDLKVFPSAARSRSGRSQCRGMQRNHQPGRCRYLLTGAGKAQTSGAMQADSQRTGRSETHRLKGGGSDNGLKVFFRPKAGRMNPAPSGLQEVDGLNHLLGIFRPDQRSARRCTSQLPRRSRCRNCSRNSLSPKCRREYVLRLPVLRIWPQFEHPGRPHCGVKA
jgi:hypothetical protein